MVSQRFSRSDFNCSALDWTSFRLTELRGTPTACAISGITSSHSRVVRPRSIAPSVCPRQLSFDSALPLLRYTFASGCDCDRE